MLGRAPKRIWLRQFNGVTYGVTSGEEEAEMWRIKSAGKPGWSIREYMLVPKRVSPIRKETTEP
jgi:hypothetical protein